MMNLSKWKVHTESQRVDQVVPTHKVRHRSQEHFKFIYMFFTVSCLTLIFLNGHPVLTLQLPCFGAAIDKKAVEDDDTHLLGQINNRMNLLRAGKRIGTSLMSNEERHFMWQLASSLTIQNCAVAFEVYYRVHSFITFHGIVMAHGYGLGVESVWKRRTL